MKIHSKFHDYYDTASTWQSDVHWQRPETTSVSLDSMFYKHTWKTKLTRYQAYFVVGFCGKLYTGIRTIASLESTYEYLDLPELNINIQKLDYISFVRINKQLYISPCLKYWEFYKVKDSFTAHQEIEQYLTNDLASQQDGLEIQETEKQVLQRHGLGDFRGKFTGRKHNV